MKTFFTCVCCLAFAIVFLSIGASAAGFAMYYKGKSDGLDSYLGKVQDGTETKDPLLGKVHLMPMLPVGRKK